MAKPWGYELWLISALEGNETHVAEAGSDADLGLTIPQLIERHGVQFLGRGNRNGRFPLLLKIINARSNLSVQVHPDDLVARELEGLEASGKNEMWYVLDATPRAALLSGLKCGIGRREYLAAEGTDRIIPLLNNFRVSPGDVFFLPAGRIHAIGAGCRLYEMQQSSDITYRIYDYESPRPLHLRQARYAITFPPKTDYRVHVDSSTLVNCRSFTTRRYTYALPCRIAAEADTFTIAYVLEGSCTIDGIELHAEEAVIITPGGASLHPHTPTTLLLTTPMMR